MSEWILTSSILIAVVIGLRFLFQGKISLRLQYALWALVLVRLLVPFSFGSTNISVMNLTERAAEQPVVIDLDKLNTPTISDTHTHDQSVPQYEAEGMDVEEFVDGPRETPHSVELADIAGIVWVVGIAAVSMVFLATNFTFRRRLMRSRFDLDITNEKLPVYASREIDTPCLFGLKEPAIYVTYEVADDPTLLRHTMEHEATHHRHGDHIWSILRVVCLAVHWYNPLVWWAAFLSQRDAELACDEDTIKRLGESERAEYGRTLLGMTCQKRSNVLITATTMTASKSGIKERILLIAKKPKMALYTLAVVVLIAAVAVGCTFTGAKQDRLEAYEKMPEYLKEYSYEQVKDRMEPEEVHYIGSVWDYALVYCSGMGPKLTLYRYEIDGDQIIVTDQACGDYAISGGLSVNHLVDGDKHIYFGTVSDYHWMPEDDSRMPIDWKLLVFYDESGSQNIVNIGDSLGYICVMDTPMTDFWVAEQNGSVPLTMEQYLQQGYYIEEETWYSESNDGESTETVPAPTKPVETKIPEATIGLPEMGTLYEAADESKVCIAVLPTGISTSGGDYRYIIPEEQDVLLEYYLAANASAHKYTQWDSSNRRAGWWIVYQDQWWQVTESGAMFGTDPENWDGICIDADDAKQLYEFCDGAVKEAGIGEPIRPEDIAGIKSATLDWNGIHTVTDEYALNKIETWIANSRESSGVACWFTAQLVLELDNGETKTITMATDSCAYYLSEGVAYGYGEITDEGIKGNEEFYSLFAPGVIHDKIREGMDVLTDYLYYLNWSRYANQYGADETFALMDMLKEWAAEEPTYNRFGTLINLTGTLDGAYAEYYAAILAELYELAGSEFRWACLGNATDQAEENTIMLLAGQWGISIEEARANMEEDMLRD